MTDKNEVRVVPYHLERLKSFSKYYVKRLEDYNSLMDAVCDDVRDTDILWVSKDHLSLAVGAYFSSKNLQRAFLHLQQYQYVGIKGIERKLLQDSEEVEVKVHGDCLQLTALSQDQRYLEGAVWSSYFWVSILLNKADDAQYLADILNRPELDWNGEDSAVYSDILAGFFHYKTIDVKASIQRYADLTDENMATPESYDFASRIALPTINVMLKVFGGASEEEYREAIYTAAQAHYEFWRQERLAGFIVGDLSLPLLALAKLAYRKFGYTLGFTTDYIPEYIYQMSPELEASIPMSFEPISSLEKES